MFWTIVEALLFVCVGIPLLLIALFAIVSVIFLAIGSLIFGFHKTVNVYKKPLEKIITPLQNILRRIDRANKKIF